MPSKNVFSKVTAPHAGGKLKTPGCLAGCFFNLYMGLRRARIPSYRDCDRATEPMSDSLLQGLLVSAELRIVGALGVLCVSFVCWSKKNDYVHI